MVKNTKYWDRRFHIGDATPQERPSKIIYAWADHARKSKSHKHSAIQSFDDAYHCFANLTGIIRDRVRRIAGGMLPTAHEIHQIRKGLGWTPAFIFGICQDEMNSKARMYFKELGVRRPTISQLQEFEDLYEELLLLRLPVKEETND